ncbi:GrpB family protein [Glutamicibacter sp. MNS18]|uniref:GrpB family protein n=1 Tax=Glutamicibacter sp. MNS18 TaxID=2989817 RepID=UPI0022358EA6|nr:GrpB family protein [Glutamicibacter sp. MNS18]MCW4464104.1 GrpB family protein [Glutamicibacter sp. MNS18]
MASDDKVQLVASRYDQWAELAAGMISRIGVALPHSRCEHIGSTSVPDLPAKDVVDILVGVNATEIRDAAARLRSLGFDLEGDLSHHCWLSWPSRNARDYVIHVVESGGRPWTRRIVFRDLLRRDQDARSEYLATKINSAAVSGNWDDYTQSKTSVVARLLAGIDAG